MSKKYQAAAIYTGLALLVMLPLLRPGFILSLDMVFAPKITIPDYASGPMYIFWAILHLLNFVIPSAVIQKAILFSILFLAGFGMYRFLQKVEPRSLTTTWHWGSYFGGILYMFNPFVYSRFMAGQFAVLLGYALLPFFAMAFIRFCSRPTMQTSLWLVGWFSLIAVISVHTLGLLIVIAGSIALFTVGKLYKMPAWRKAFLKWTALTILAIIVINSYWLIPAALGKGMTAEIVGNFTIADQHAFATDPGRLGLFGNVLALQGFWGESKNLFMTSSDTYSWWLVPIVLLWILMIIGLVVSYRSRRNVTLMMITMIVVGTVLSIGTAGTFFAPFNEFLIKHVPFFAGYREPQKFVGLVAFGYGYLGAVAVSKITLLMDEKKNIKQYVQPAVLALMTIPIMGSSLMLWGFRGQLHAVDYPVEWYAARDMIKPTCTDNCQILFLPWHLYMRYDFAGRVIASPARKFFGNNVLASNDPEMKGASSYRLSDDQRLIEKLLPLAAKGDASFVPQLKQHHIKFIILAKENDYKKYDFLDNQNGLKLLHDMPSLKLYEVTQ